MTGWQLDDGEALAAAHSDTFRIAPLATRRSLGPGCYAKLMFTFDADGEAVTERMWTVILSNDEGIYRGRLVNEPAATPDDPRLHYLCEVAYEARHIINWDEADARSLALVADPNSEV